MHRKYHVVVGTTSSAFLAQRQKTALVTKYIPRSPLVHLAAFLGLGWMNAVDAAGTVYVSAYYGPGVGTYDAATGVAIDSSFVSVQNYPRSVALSGNQLFVADFVNSSTGQGSVGVYDATTGTPINNELLPSLYRPSGLAVSGNDLFVSFAYSNTVGKYNANTGDVLNASFLTDTPGGRPFFLAVSGNNLYVSGNSGNISKYDAMTGATINFSFISGLGSALGMAVSGNTLYVASSSTGTVGSYDATTGTPINATLITGLSYPAGLALAGNDLYVANSNNGVLYGSVGVYDAMTGAAINSSLITGLNAPWGIAVSPVPEPSCGMICLVALSLYCFTRQRQNVSETPSNGFGLAQSISQLKAPLLGD